MSYAYAIRIQNYPTYDEIIQQLFSDTRFSKCIRIHHTGKKRDNPHFHLLVECDYQQQTLRKHLNKYLTLAKGNKHVSVKDWDGRIRAIAYLYHEDTEPDMIRNISDEELEKAKEINRATKEKFKSNAPAKIVQEAIEYFIYKPNFKPSMKDIFDFVFDRLRESGDWLPNKFQFERWAMRIQASVRPQHEWHSYKTNLYESWYGQCAYL